MSEKRGSFLLRRYPLHKLGSFFSAAGWHCWAHGFVLAFTKHGGIMVAWVRKEPAPMADSPQESEVHG